MIQQVHTGTLSNGNPPAALEPREREEIQAAPKDSVFLDFKRTVRETPVPQKPARPGLPVPRPVIREEVVGREVRFKDGVIVQEDTLGRTVTVLQNRPGDAPTTLAVFEETRLSLPQDTGDGGIALSNRELRQEVNAQGGYKLVDLTNQANFQGGRPERGRVMPWQQDFYYVSKRGNGTGTQHRNAPVRYSRMDVRSPFLHNHAGPVHVFAHETPEGTLKVPDWSRSVLHWPELKPFLTTQWTVGPAPR